ncbi:MAG: ABC transporter [Euryarchaeota archaeon CG01_land_8_20_14_3_00_38_12]|nr:MAG: ABC transporter [Euryarchaeota archaeon CG01_land_8_20_14_3_00_38_12]PJB21771.1 MAG: ABC transporter [Euryarchaeota archaeon CG_4_9_14_3_um_filter_38_12]
MIKLENISKNWENFSLKNINLEIKNNEYFVILGPTGAGKTLLLETIAGFHYPDSGKIIINNKDITFFPPEKRNTGFVYQDFMLFNHKTVFENIAYGLRIRGIKNVEEQVEKMADLVNVKHLLSRYPSTLSGGEKQRTAIARALIIKPSILLMDEPLSALDALTQKKLRDELKKIHSETKVTTIHVTHDQEEALVLGDRIGIVDKGKIVQTGTPEEIFRKPTSEFVANFVGAENIFTGTAETKENITEIKIKNVVLYSTSTNLRKQICREQESKDSCENKKSGKVNVSVRPEDIIISKERMKSSARNVLFGNVVEIKDKGAIIQLIVDCGLPFTAVITRQSFLDLNINIGASVYLYFKAGNVHLF